MISKVLVCLRENVYAHPIQTTPVFLSGESQGRGSLVSCRLRGRTESDTTEAKERRFPCVVWKGFPAFPAHLRMRPVSRGDSTYMQSTS